MVSDCSHFARRNSTVPPKYTPSVISIELLICPWEALLLQDCHTLPKRNILLLGLQHPPKVKYLLEADLAILQGSNQDGDTHTSRHDSQDGLEC